MQDADEAVAQRAQGLVVGVVGGAMLVVERSGARTVVTGHRTPIGRRRRRGGGCARGGPARRASCRMPRSAVRFRRSFCETWRRCIGSGRPRTHRAPGRRGRHQVLAGSGRCRRPGVASKWVARLVLKLVDLAIELADDADRSAGGGRRTRAASGAGAASCSVRNAALISRARAVDVALTATAFERGLDGRSAIGGLPGRAWSAIEHPQGITVG